jgi:hypothetical protein
MAKTKAKKLRNKNIRIHARNSQQILDFLSRNKKTFQVEKTVTGFPTYLYKGKSVYVREKAMGRGAINKILMFQNDVVKSDLYKFCNRFSVKDLEDESLELERTLLYSGYLFNPHKEKSFQKVIKIDCNTAYWQTCRYFEIITANTYRDIVKTCTKPTRLKITGTLGRKSYMADYVEGKRMGDSYLKVEKKKRIVFQNLYNRVRKFVDEIMIWSLEQNPENFIGFYVDCIWLREYDTDLIDFLKNVFNVKVEVVDLEVKFNAHGKAQVIELGEYDIKPYTALFKSNEFVSYKKFFNFTPDLGDINLKIRL